MLYLTKADGRCTIHCSCGCFHLSFHDRVIAYDGSVTCLVCHESSNWADLVREHEEDLEAEEAAAA